MAIHLYSPIIKGKLNDLKALGRLSSKARAIVKPMIEAMPLPKGGDVETHISKLAHYLVKHAPLGDLYLDFYGLNPGLKMPDGSDAVIAGFNLVRALGRTVTPAYGFDRDDSLWQQLRSVVQEQGQGFCFRIDIDDLDDLAEDTWAQLLERSASLNLKPPQIDLMLDLRFVGDIALDDLQHVVVNFFALIPSSATYRNIILVGSSALKTVSAIPIDGVDAIVRNELVLWSRIQRDITSTTSLIFGDYGVIHPDFSDQGPNKYMNGKIRYTHRGRINYFRGHGLNHPVKDYVQYHSLAAQVRDSPHYQGRDFSYGDWYIDMVADFNTTPGSPGTWVYADMNHHLEYTAKQMATLVQKVHEVNDETELEELT